jgi:hypothetical protein
MPVTKKELSKMLIEAFETIGEEIDAPITFHFKGFNQSSVQTYLEEWIRLSQDESASLKMAAEYDHFNESIQCWVYYNDYHNAYYDDSDESVIGISGELSDEDKDSEGSDEE